MTCLPSLVKNLVFCRWKTWKVNGFIQDKKKYNKMMNKYLKKQYPIENVYNSYKIHEDFFYTFNNNDNWLHTKIELRPRQRRTDIKIHNFDKKCSL